MLLRQNSVQQNGNIQEKNTAAKQRRCLADRKLEIAGADLEGFGESHRTP